jgi:hypothetical protein
MDCSNAQSSRQECPLGGSRWAVLVTLGVAR